MDETVLTIGNFDGVHLGHLALLKRLKEEGKKTAVLTFSNHPSEVLKEKKTKCITTLSHKLKLLQLVDNVIVKKFTKELSQLSAYSFLEQVKKEFPFTKLILGENAHLGHKREAGAYELKQIGSQLGFEFIAFSLHFEEGVICSSSAIRQLISQGNLQAASKFLGRPFSIMAKVESGDGKGRLIGCRTINLPVDSLILPPLGVYIVSVRCPSGVLKGVANLGYAPTLKDLKDPLLEVHLLDAIEEPFDEVEVIFHQFIREENKFSNTEALKEQIALDISFTKKYFNLI